MKQNIYIFQPYQWIDSSTVFKPKMVKLGISEKHPLERLQDAQNSFSASIFELKYWYVSEQAPRIESLLKAHFQGLAVQGRTEMFWTTPLVVKNLLERYSFQLMVEQEIKVESKKTPRLLLPQGVTVSKSL